MKITSEQMLLDQATRKKLIESFDTGASAIRKREAFKGYECLKDKTSTYVYELLKSQFDADTVAEMQYAISNVSILRKVIEKLAKVYSNGVKRTMPGAEKEDAAEGTSTATATVESVAEHLSLNDAMAKGNRYYRTFKNALVYVRPLKVDDKYDLKIEIKAPFNYDVIENPDNPEEALAVVLSDYAPTRENLYAINAATAGREGSNVGVVRNVGGSESSTEEGDKREFIWWSKNYHFTTNAKGEFINVAATPDGAPADLTNPIAMLPFVNLAGDQDGCFWAEGGADLIDAGVKINTMITNVSHVAVSQGYGQLYMVGVNLPKKVKVGPNHCVQLEHTEGTTAPQVGYLNSNPPINDLRGLVEMAVALMLTTNNLSTSGFSLSLQGGKDFASGIALMIDKSESNEDIGEQAKIFVTREPHVWKRIAAWAEVYRERGALIEAWATLALPKEIEQIQIAFPSPKPMVSEKEELEVIEKRYEMGLNTRAELLMRDDPSLSEQEATEKLAKIDAEKQERVEAMLDSEGDQADGDQSQENGGEPEQDDDNARPNFKPKRKPFGQS